MGIRFVPESASWSYGGFDEFRKRLAIEIGLDLDQMKGFGGDISWDVADPITLLLSHSDCEGSLSPIECQQIAPRLRDLFSTWSSELGTDEGYDKTNALRLVDAMQICVAEQIPLLFR